MHLLMNKSKLANAYQKQPVENINSLLVWATGQNCAAWTHAGSSPLYFTGFGFYATLLGCCSSISVSALRF